MNNGFDLNRLSPLPFNTHTSTMQLLDFTPREEAKKHNKVQSRDN